jgi:hypothetical protein
MVLAGTCYLKSKSLSGAGSVWPIHSIQVPNIPDSYFSDSPRNLSSNGVLAAPGARR